MLWETKYAMPYLVIHIVPTPPEPVKLLYPYERSANGKAQDKVTGVLSSEHLSGIPPTVKLYFRNYIGKRITF
jgi:hypothetical protein